MKADLVCKGGGVKGIALVGAIAHLERQGYEWDKIAGTSAGAIVGSLLAVGYSAIEIRDIMYSLDFTLLKDKNKLSSLYFVGDLFNFISHKGVYMGDYIESFFYDKFKEKGKIKFKDISVNGISKLKVIAVDVTNKKLLILPDDLINYNIDPMEFEISKAVRMSLSIPFFYKPVKLKHNDKTSLIVDGGLISTFPIWIFDVDGIPKWPTFGLNLIDSHTSKSPKRNTVKNYMFDVIETSLYTGEDVYFKDKDSVRIINIPTLNIDTVNFNLSKKEQFDLYKSGYDSARLFLNNWDFNNYIYRYRNN